VARAGVLAATSGLKAESVLEGNAMSKTSSSTRPEVSSLGRKADQAARDAAVTLAEKP
jgi:hypothetical protein